MHNTCALHGSHRDASLAIEHTLRTRGQLYNGYPVSAGYYGAYSMDGLALALHCVYHTSDFGQALEKCISG